MKRIAAIGLGIGIAFSAAAHESPGGAPVRLGKVHFQVECSAAAQREFNLAMAYYHSFAWEEMRAPYERALQADPSCGMVHWLRALSALGNPFIWPTLISPAILASGPGYLDAARSTGLKSQRERDYVDALGAYFKDHDKLDHRVRAKALESGARAGHAALSAGPGSGGAVCAGPVGELRPRRQEVHQPAQGRAHPGADFHRAARASRRRPLPDPQL